jgi:uncharacterized membrane protein
VFEFFTAFENFPKFMRHVHEVQHLGGDRWHWKVAGPGGVAFEWDGLVTRRIDAESVSWTSTEGALIHNRGEATFERISDSRTRMVIHLVYAPPLGVIGHGIARLLGADPKRELDDDMLRFKSLLEAGRATGRDGVVTREDLQRAKSS